MPGYGSAAASDYGTDRASYPTYGGSTGGLDKLDGAQSGIRSKVKDLQVPNTIPATMDFSTFRESGELSDMTVLVGGKEFKLHKFPLYIRSDYFKQLVREESSKCDRIELDDFPGGATIFELVANYCYNKTIDITRENVCLLRCAAEFLQMCSPGNLSHCCDQFLVDVLTSAKLGRDVGAIVDLVLSCKSLGDIAQGTNIIHKCMHGIVDCWLLSSKWTKRRQTEKPGITDTEIFHKLNKLPLSWFKELFVAARDKRVRPNVLAYMVQMYISSRSNDGKTNVESKESADEKPTEITTDEQKITKAKPEADENDESKIANHEEDQDESSGEHDNGKDLKDDSSVEEKKPTEPTPESMEDEDNENLVDVMDTLLLELPDDAPLAEILEPQWVIKMLGIATDLACKCKDMLLKLAGRMLHRFQPDDLGNLSPDLLQAVLYEASRDVQHVDQNVVCSVIDSYLLELVEKDELNIDIFARMVDAVPKDFRLNHDAIYLVLEKLLNSERHQVSSDEEKEKLLETVDFQRLSEDALQRAYTSQLVPISYITRAALALCSRLRRELDTAKDIIHSQEEELERYGLGSYGDRSGAILRTTRHRDADNQINYTASNFQSSPCDENDENDPLIRYENTGIYNSHDPDPDPEILSDYGKPSYDPILAKVLGEGYPGDPLALDSQYPLGYSKTYDRYLDARNSGNDNSDTYGRFAAYSTFSYSPFDPRYYSSPQQKW